MSSGIGCAFVAVPAQPPPLPTLEVTPSPADDVAKPPPTLAALLTMAALDAVAPAPPEPVLVLLAAEQPNAAPQTTATDANSRQSGRDMVASITACRVQPADWRPP